MLKMFDKMHVIVILAVMLCCCTSGFRLPLDPEMVAEMQLPNEIKDGNLTYLDFYLGEGSLESQWKNFKIEHNKQYSDANEEKRRKDIFLDNLEKILEHNSLYEEGLKSYTLGVNEFADMQASEFARMMKGLKIPNSITHRRPAHGQSVYLSPAVKMEIPNTVDWRDKGYVTTVKNQGRCGSCWAFSATGALEGQHFRKTGQLVSLSEQNLVDCSTGYGNEGCGGGFPDNAFQYVSENGGIDTEESYPYTAQDGQCNFSRDAVGATDSGYTDIPEGDEHALKEACATVGPISVGIAVTHSFQLYKNGVFDEPGCEFEQIDHAVLVVGYGQMDGRDYWLVKNSWGESWGQNGYVYMSRNKNNQCKIASMASYPNV